MSKAVICDRCKAAFEEQNSTHIESKWTFITAHYDLCPRCASEFKEEFMKVKQRHEEANANA